MRPRAALAVPFHVGERVEGFPLPAGATALDPILGEGTAQDRMVELFRQLADGVAASAVDRVYAADCMAPLGVLAGLQRRGVRPFIVWLDAHGDFNTWETTPSGYIGGMPLAILVGREERRMLDGIGLDEVEEARILLCDAREVDPREGVALDRSAVRLARFEELPGLLPAEVPIYLHLDLDVVRPSEMPALRYPAAGGPGLEQVGDFIHGLAATGRLVCATIGCTWDPAHAEAGEALKTTERLVSRLEGD
ncbi:MAG: arginase family protein [Thermoanaerobaculia bacterium]